MLISETSMPNRPKKSELPRTLIQQPVKVYSIEGAQIGYGYIYIAGNGNSFPEFYTHNGKEMPAGIYDIRPNGESKLVVSPRSVQ